jgi:predicted phosphoadenosine phosphosulfate sulfurtransferase
MKYDMQQTVWDESLDRIRFLFDEFDEVAVSMSGGKDSAVVFELAMIVARERNQLPLKVMWLDQECEFEGTVEYMRSIFYRPDVDPYWMQVPFRLQNATSAKNLWLNCWGEGEDWLREKDPIAHTKNVYGTDRFVPLMEAIQKTEFGSKRTAVLTGVRTEESPARFMAMTCIATYKGRTWGNVVDATRDLFTFSPIYDWSYFDIWKAINDNNWAYNTFYDALYRHGVPVHKMRVSNYHHETAVHALFMLQEIEPETYARATQRISGLDTAAKMGKADFFVHELPFMFTDWREYRDYLLEHIIIDPKHRASFARTFLSMEVRYPHEVGKKLYAVQVNSLLANDVEHTKLDNW